MFTTRHYRGIIHFYSPGEWWFDLDDKKLTNYNTAQITSLSDTTLLEAGC